jgi:hypothetical protein
MFYANESFYLFEGPSPLIRIPRLPIDIDAGAHKEIEKHFEAYRKLSLGISVPQKELQGIAGSMTFTDGESVTLSGWGRIFWDRFTRTFYELNLHPSPIPGIVLKDSFRKDMEKWKDNKTVLFSVNQRLDDLARYLLNGRKECPKRLDFKAITGDLAKKTGCTHEFDVWEGWRGFCRVLDGGKIEVAHFENRHP